MDMPNDILSFDFPLEEEILKLVPIIKDEDDPEDIKTKFRIGVVTSIFGIDLFIKWIIEEIKNPVKIQKLNKTVDKF